MLTLSGVILGLQFLLYEPEPTDPLNNDAAEMLRNSKTEFAKAVLKTMKGGYYFGCEFSKLI